MGIQSMEGETDMTGLEKITDRILAEARAQADEIREKAEEEAGAVLPGNGGETFKTPGGGEGEGSAC